MSNQAFLGRILLFQAAWKIGERAGSHLAHVRDHVGFQHLDQMRWTLFAQSPDRVMESAAQHDKIRSKGEGPADVEAAGDT